ncbi:hypothetical protein FXO38_29686 [Capsicum annuum]|nr:hypothetical protein FXO37_33415 [Capsicum annuum]KAF3625596.1 hypothetical protein FXO38_29686 [Capsicum annuum]
MMMKISVQGRKRNECIRKRARNGLFQIRNETPELSKGAAKAMYDLYEVVSDDLLSSDLREQLGTWNILARARNEGRLFSRVEWPRDPEIKEQVKRLHLLLTVKDSAANIPKNLEARRRLEFFTNSLFMDMPSAKPVSEMMPFCVFTPYYSETVLYSSSDLRVENEDGISTLFYLQKIFPDGASKLHLVQWEKKTTTENWGGLGVKDLRRSDLTVENLKKRKFICISRRFLCKETSEDVDLVLHCSSTSRLWWDMFSWFGIYWMMPRSVKDTLSCWKFGKNRRKCRAWNVVPLALMWIVWCERNRGLLKV